MSSSSSLILTGHLETRYVISSPSYPPLLSASAAHVPTLLRALVGCDWFDLESWIDGALVDFQNYPIQLPCKAKQALALAEYFLQRYPRESSGPMRGRVYALIGKRYLPKWIKVASLQNLVFPFDEIDKPRRKESDALDKLRFLSVTEPELLKEAVDLDIRIQTDIDNEIITIVDTGIGMTKQEVIDCLGTIAQSGTAKFSKAVKDSKEAGVDSNLISQFGVGFYSAFLISDKVVVSTKSSKSDKQYVWEGEANASSYIVREETDPEKLIPRGTCLTLYLKVEVEDEPTDAKKDGEGDPKTEKKKKTKKVVERYWDWELTNETKPIWLRNPKDVSTEEYNEF
ncbi:hypothetical protein ACLOJK_000549 [Asimina triloba]